MKCREVEQTLTEDLGTANESEIRSHISSCTDCQRLVQELQSIEDLQFSLARMTEAPVDFSQAVTTRLQRKRWRQVVFAATGATVFIAGLTGLLMVRPFLAGESNSIAVFGVESLAGRLSGTPANMILADPSASTDLEELYLEVILGEPSRGSSQTRGVPSEIQVHRTDMGRVSLTYASY